MAKATITIEDTSNNEQVSISLKFDPPLTGEEKQLTPAQTAAANVVALLTGNVFFTDENGEIDEASGPVSDRFDVSDES